MKLHTTLSEIRNNVFFSFSQLPVSGTIGQSSHIELCLKCQEANSLSSVYSMDFHSLSQYQAIGHLMEYIPTSIGFTKIHQPVLTQESYPDIVLSVIDGTLWVLMVFSPIDPSCIQYTFECFAFFIRFFFCNYFSVDCFSRASFHYSHWEEWPKHRFQMRS